MLKRYAPYILLLLAALLLYYVKTNQRGSRGNSHTETTSLVNSNEGFSRQPEKIIYTRHARCRMECRHISESEVLEILKGGKLNSKKIVVEERGKSYPLEGKTAGDKLVRIVVAPKGNDLVVVTVIDLDTDWPCDCK
jgi:hypothetical protein